MRTATISRKDRDLLVKMLDSHIIGIVRDDKGKEDYHKAVVLQGIISQSDTINIR